MRRREAKPSFLDLYHICQRFGIRISLLDHLLAVFGEVIFDCRQYLQRPLVVDQINGRPLPTESPRAAYAMEIRLEVGVSVLINWYVVVYDEAYLFS